MAYGDAPYPEILPYEGLSIDPASETDDSDSGGDDQFDDENDDAARFLAAAEARLPVSSPQAPSRQDDRIDSTPQRLVVDHAAPLMTPTDVRQAIACGTWFDCSGSYRDESLRFKLRIVDFTCTSPAEIDPKIDVVVEGVLWLLRLEVVNLCREPVSALRVKQLISLLDDEDFRFDAFFSPLDRDRSRGLRRFSDWSDNPPLSPKIKAAGAIAFQLPFELASYRIAIKNGEIAPVDPE